jgi:dienelactone hydrolase
MRLAPLEMSVSAGDGLILKGTLTYPDGKPGSGFPLAVLAHQYPATRDCFSPLVDDLLAQRVATLAFDQRGHGASITSPGGPVVIDTPSTLGLAAFGEAFMGSVGKVGFDRIANDILRVTSWGAAQNFVDPSRLVLVGGSVGGSGVLLAAPELPGLRAVATLGAAGALAFGADGPDRIRSSVERVQAAFYLAASQEDPFDGAKNAEVWSRGVARAQARIVPGSGHAMAIYFEVREELLALLRKALQLS